MLDEKPTTNVAFTTKTYTNRFQRRTTSFFIHCPPRFITIEKWSSALLQTGCHYSNIKTLGDIYC